MNNNMMLLMVLAMGSSSSSNGSKGGSSDFLDAYLISSNMMPEMMRLMFAMMSIQKRRDQADALAKETNDKANVLARETVEALGILSESEVKNARITIAQLNARPELKALLDRVSSTEKDKVVGDTPRPASLPALPPEETESVSATRVVARSKGKQA